MTIPKNEPALIWLDCLREFLPNAPTGEAHIACRISGVTKANAAMTNGTPGAALVSIRRLDGDAEVSVIVLPARAGRQSTPAGDLLEWWCGDDAAGPECRVFVSPDREPLVRSRLLDRLGIQGGTHELESIEFESPNHADGVGTPAGS